MESFILVSLVKEIHFLFLLSECQTSQLMCHFISVSFDKRDSFNFSIVRMPDKSSNVPFHFGLFDKRDSFPFSIVRMPDKSSNLPSSIVYSAICAESLRIARASNSPETFSTVIEPLIARMRGRGYAFEKQAVLF